MMGKLKAVDVMTGEVLHEVTTDALIRHKWPEEKPEYVPDSPKKYLVYDGDFVKATYHPDGYFYYYNADECVDMSEPIYWWHLPEVGNDRP